ncbi:NAD-dependent epimerase/dehydratase family protein [Thermobifida halotolerans]|uniref:NAD-dependent epimerase/dehydratase family protein n=1 Tax=Thermobifida halotolerans TaxID=483545 RepID=A0AA97M2N1_9ACTN|nr:NAD-dependent epimerase/dehydratase family protein [Thermobifida halotolerans]UOE22245.1 NAD-dependent epimerase/dehydratase family protein [Thermobifida halotolerans]
MRVLVTGASGFLGSHVAEACLRAGDEVRALVRPTSDPGHLRTLPGVEIVHGDLGDTASLRAAAEGVDVVHHSAARVLDHGSRAQFWDTNVEGTRRLLEAARDGGARRFVFVSSPSAVMDGRDQVDVDESIPYPRRYLNLYSQTKAAAERLVLAADAPGFTTCALRPRAVWGPRDRHGFMPKLLGRLLAGRLPDLSGGRRVTAALCHCANAAHACVLAARADGVGGRAYFVTDAEPVDVWAFMAEVAEMFGAPPPRRRVPPVLRDALVEAVELAWRMPFLAHHHDPPLSRYSVALLTRSSTYDTAAARRDLGYRPLVDRSTGLEGLRSWVEEIGGPGVWTEGAR